MTILLPNPNSSLEMRANLESMDNRATIVNSIAESDELLDYGMNCMLLAEVKIIYFNFDSRRIWWTYE